MCQISFVRAPAIWDQWQGARVSPADPWSIGDIGILDNNQLANGPGIRERNLWQEMVQKVLEY